MLSGAEASGDGKITSILATKDLDEQSIVNVL